MTKKKKNYSKESERQSRKRQSRTTSLCLRYYLLKLLTDEQKEAHFSFVLYSTVPFLFILYDTTNIHMQRKHY